MRCLTPFRLIIRKRRLLQPNSVRNVIKQIWFEGIADLPKGPFRRRGNSEGIQRPDLLPQHRPCRREHRLEHHAVIFIQVASEMSEHRVGLHVAQPSLDALNEQ